MKNKKLLVLLAATISLGGASLFTNARSTKSTEAKMVQIKDLEPSGGLSSEIEPNNEFAYATDMTKGCFSASDYTKSYGGRLSFYNDPFDIYSFTILGNANVEIKLTGLASNCDYDIELYEFSRIMHEDRHTVEEILNENVYSTPKKLASSNATFGKDEYISINLKPNIYYIRVRGYNCGSDSNYKISASVKYVQSSNNDIYSLKNNYKGALWYSDYNPFGVQPNRKFKDIADTTDRYIDTINNDRPFRSPFYKYISEQVRIKNASLYLWDKDFIRYYKELSLINIAMYEIDKKASEEQLNRDEIMQEFVNEIFDINEALNCLEVELDGDSYDDFTKFTTKIKIFKKIKEGAETVTNFFTGFSISLFFTVPLMNDMEVRAYEINDAKKRIEFWRAVYYNCEAVLEDTEDTKIVKIDYYYKLRNNPTVFPEYIYEFDGRSSDITNGSRVHINNDTYFNGTLFPIQTYNEIEARFNRS